MFVKSERSGSGMQVIRIFQARESISLHITVLVAGFLKLYVLSLGLYVSPADSGSLYP